MVLVIMAVDHLGRLVRVVSGIVPMRRRGDRPEDGSGDHPEDRSGNRAGASLQPESWSMVVRHGMRCLEALPPRFANDGADQANQFIVLKLADALREVSEVSKMQLPLLPCPCLSYRPENCLWPGNL
jgi:hypothetical protein